jgi:hypothetical protein
MNLIFQRLAVIVVCFTVLMGGGSRDAKAAAPRAWLVSKGSAQAVLVGESHFGTPTESDNYFSTVVQPSYVVANAAVMETFWGPEQRGNEGFDRSAPCFIDPKDRRTDRLKAAFEQLTAALRANNQEVPSWLESWEMVPEFLLTSIHLSFQRQNSIDNRMKGALEAQLGSGVSFRLRTSNTGPDVKHIRGLESLKDRRAIFCGASAAHRQDFIADDAQALVGLLRQKQSNPNYAGLDKLGVLMGQVTDQLVRCVDRATPCTVEKLSPDIPPLQEVGWMQIFSPGTFEISLKQRTRAWVPLIENAIMAHRRTFVIVGAMHLPDLSIGGKVEPGLISLLRQRGFTVKVIAGPDDIKDSYLSPSWGDRM